MKTYFVFLGPHDCSDEFHDKITRHVAERYASSLSRLRCAWVVVAAESADEIRDGIISVIGPTEKLLVARAGTEAAWHGFNALDSEWLLNTF